MDFKKDKNMLYFTTSANKTYGLNINTGDFYGLRGKPIKTVPAEITTHIKNLWWHGDNTTPNILKIISRLIGYYGYSIPDIHNHEQLIRIMGICDKFDAVGIFFTRNDLDFLRTQMDFCEKNFKKIVKAYKAGEVASLSAFYEDCDLDDFISVNNVQITPYFTRENAKTLREVCRSDWNKEQVHMVYYQMENGLYDFVHEFGGYSCSSNIRDAFTDFFKWRKGLNLPYFEKGNFIKIFSQTYKNYLIHKQEIDNQQLAEWEMGQKEALTFENDTFKVIIPTTAQEFEDEAKMQSNCVFSMYLSRCIRRNTRVVFVRKKSCPDKSYITCEVNNSGFIYQYLCRFNEYPRNEEDINFRDMYQEHIDEYWK